MSRAFRLLCLKAGLNAAAKVGLGQVRYSGPSAEGFQVPIPLLNCTFVGKNNGFLRRSMSMILV